MTRSLLTPVTVLLVAVASWTAQAGDQPAAKAEAQAPPPVRGTTGQKRDWLKNQLVKDLQNDQQARELQAKIDRMSRQQIEALTNIALAQQQPAQQANQQQQQQQQQQQMLLDQTQLELARARQMRQMLENELWWRQYNSVGFMPVITWLPQGTQLGASAVVSPDRRYVRIGANPFFSSVGPVYSYNLNNGQSYLMPQYGYGYPGYYPNGYAYPNNRPAPVNVTPPSNYDHRSGQMPPWHKPPEAPSAYPKVWHDGLRTRTDPKPGR